MVTGGKVGSIIGRRRAFAIGCVIYGAGVADHGAGPEPGRPGARLVVAGGHRRGPDHAGHRRAGRRQLPPARSPAGLRAGHGGRRGRGRGRPAHRRLRHHLLLVALGVRRRGPRRAGILVLARRVQDAPPESRPKLDLVGSVLSAAGLGLAVFGVLRSSEWGWVLPKPDGPELLGVSLTVWLILGGLFVVWLFLGWERRLEARGAEPLVRPELLGNRQLAGGLVMFFFQFLIQAGLFFTIPLFLSVALGLSALDTGIRILPLSITLLARRRRHPPVLPRRLTPAGGPARAAGHAGGHRRPVRQHRPRRRGRDRDRAAAARRARDRGARLPARQRDGVGGARRGQPGGRRAAEHRDEPGRLARHGPGRLDPDRRR